MAKKKLLYDAEWELFKKAVNDQDFCEQVERNPKKELEKILGFELPKGIKVETHRDEIGVINISLPPDVSKLTEQQLRLVSGGASRVGSMESVRAAGQQQASSSSSRSRPPSANDRNEASDRAMDRLNELYGAQDARTTRGR